MKLSIIFISMKNKNQKKIILVFSFLLVCLFLFGGAFILNQSLIKYITPQEITLTKKAKFVLANNFTKDTKFDPKQDVPNRDSFLPNIEILSSSYEGIENNIDRFERLSSLSRIGNKFLRYDTRIITQSEAYINSLNGSEIPPLKQNEYRFPVVTACDQDTLRFKGIDLLEKKEDVLKSFTGCVHNDKFFIENNSGKDILVLPGSKGDYNGKFILHITPDSTTYFFSYVACLLTLTAILKYFENIILYYAKLLGNIFISI